MNLTYLAFIAKAVADRLRKHPSVNAAVSGESTVFRRDINLGIAVALDWGLIVPVIKHADELSLLGVARAINDLGERARTKKLSPDEVQRGTFTITNPGVFGSVIGTPIINQPQAAILCVGAIEKQPAVITVDGSDTLAIRTKGMLSLAFDHRIVDGADADRFMADVKQMLQEFPEARSDMPRTLTVSRVRVRAGRETEYLSAVRELAALHEARGKHLWVFRRAGLPDSFLECSESRSAETHRAVADGAGGRAPARSPAPRGRRVRAGRLGPVGRSEERHVMPRRIIEVDGEPWEVAVSGRSTQYTKDEFGLVFSRGTGPEPGAARRALHAARRQEPRAVAEPAERPGAAGAAGALAAVLDRARDGVPPLTTPDRRSAGPAGRPARALDRVRRQPAAGAGRGARAARRVSRPWRSPITIPSPACPRPSRPATASGSGWWAAASSARPRPGARCTCWGTSCRPTRPSSRPSSSAAAPIASAAGVRW